MSDTRTFTSFDGTRIAWRVVGEGEQWLVLAQGYGGTFNAYDPLVARLRDRFKFLLWDYRGMHASAVPQDPHRLRIEDHVRDLAGLMAEAGVKRCVLGGWSVGVQVALEAWHRLRNQYEIQALVLINGAYERVLDQAFGGSPRARTLGRLLVGTVERASPLVTAARPLLKRVGRSRITLPLLEATGNVTGRPEAILPAVQSILDLDFGRYMRMVRLAADHATSPWLGEIDIPVLVTGGARDPLTPAHLARELVARLPRGTYHEFPAGTHYTVMEFPGELAALIRRFVDGIPKREIPNDSE